MTNRFKGLDLIDRVPENYGQSSLTLYRKLLSQPSPRKRNAKVGGQETPGITGRFGLEVC